MDLKRFGSAKTGHLVALNAKESAFVPDPLPPNWRPSDALHRMIADARQELGTLNGIGFNLPNPEILLRPLQNREALRSSSLEGTFATPQELLIFELDPNERNERETTDRLSDFREVSNYGLALRNALSSKLPLSLRLIRDMHRDLLTGVRGKDQSPGDFRRGQVHIGSDKRFIPPPLNHLDSCLSDFEKYIHGDSDLDPLVKCYLAHYQFETIHPFYDGNGRVGRLLLALMTQLTCRMSKPWLYMSAYFDRYKDEYIANLFNVSAMGAWDEWLAFCLRGTISQARDTIARCGKLLAVRDRFVAKISESRGSARLNAIADRLFVSPFVSIPEIAYRQKVSYPTAKADVERLCRIGILEFLNEDRRPALYYAKDIFNVAYEEHGT